MWPDVPLKPFVVSKNALSVLSEGTITDHGNWSVTYRKTKCLEEQKLLLEEGHVSINLLKHFQSLFAGTFGLNTCFILIIKDKPKFCDNWHV